MFGCRNFCDCRENWMEITVAILVVPEVMILILYIFVTNDLSLEQEIASLAFGGFIIILRPIVFCRRQNRTRVQSIYLPNSVIADENDVAVKVDGESPSVGSDALMISNRESL